jgi:hypothetical protein
LGGSLLTLYEGRGSDETICYECAYDCILDNYIDLYVRDRSSGGYYSHANFHLRLGAGWTVDL